MQSTVVSGHVLRLGAREVRQLCRDDATTRVGVVNAIHAVSALGQLLAQLHDAVVTGARVAQHTGVRRAYDEHVERLEVLMVFSRRQLCDGRALGVQRTGTKAGWKEAIFTVREYFIVGVVFRNTAPPRGGCSRPRTVPNTIRCLRSRCDASRTWWPRGAQDASFVFERGK